MHHHHLQSLRNKLRVKNLRFLSDNTWSKVEDEVIRLKSHAKPSLFEIGSTNNGNRLGATTYSSPPPLPLPRRFKMNTDGSCHPNHGHGLTAAADRVMRGPSGFAGVLEDDSGKWVKGFRGFIGVTDSLTAELHGILKGLELLDKHGFRESVLESDCRAAVDWVTGQDDEPGNSRIIGDCWEVIKKSRHLVLKNKISVRCCCRNDNKAANKLANVAVKKEEGYMEMIDLPDEIKQIVNHES